MLVVLLALMASAPERCRSVAAVDGSVSPTNACTVLLLVATTTVAPMPADEPIAPEPTAAKKPLFPFASTDSALA